MEEEALKHQLSFGMPFLRRHSDLKLFRSLDFACVYAVGPESGRPIKIGWTENPKHRFSQLQNAHWKPLKTHDLIWTAGRPLAIRLEKELHRLFTKGGRHIRGEWFDVPVDMVVPAFQIAAENAGVPTFTHSNMIERFFEARDLRAQSTLKKVGMTVDIQAVS